MGQERFWNYQDDDSTWRLNWKDLIIIPYGLYSGFDAELNAGMVLTLSHTSGDVKVRKDLTKTPKMGVWKSRQGVVVTEDAAINLNITTGDATKNRIDLIVAEHEYVEATGGASATYKVIQGVAATNPVAPALQDDTKQIVLGQLYVPAGTSSLDAAGVAYTKATAPDMGGDPTIMHTNKEQTSTALKIFNAQRGIAVVTELVGTALKTDTASNFYVLVDAAPDDTYKTLRSLTKDLKGAGHLITVFTTQRLKLSNSWINSSSALGGGMLPLDVDKLLVPEGVRYIEANTCFSLLDISDTHSNDKVWTVVSGGEAVTSTLNKYRGMEIWQKSASPMWLNGTKFMLPAKADGNYFQYSQADRTISSLESLTKFTKATSEAGGVIIVRFNLGGCTVKHNQSAPTGAKKILVPTEKDFGVPAGSFVMFMEDSTEWRVLSVWGSKHSVLALTEPKTKVYLDTQPDNLPNPLIDDGGVQYRVMDIAKDMDCIVNSTIASSTTITMGLPASYPIGSRLRWVQRAGAIQITQDAFTANTEWVPIRRMGGVGLSGNFTVPSNTVSTVIRMDDHWLWVQESAQSDWNETDPYKPAYIKNKPVAEVLPYVYADIDVGANTATTLKSHSVDSIYVLDAGTGVKAVQIYIDATGLSYNTIPVGFFSKYLVVFNVLDQDATGEVTTEMFLGSVPGSGNPPLAVIYARLSNVPASGLVRVQLALLKLE